MLKKIASVILAMVIAAGFFGGSGTNSLLMAAASAETAASLTEAEIQSFEQNYAAHGRVPSKGNSYNTKATGIVTIRDIQILLNFVGNYGIKTDGTFDAATKKAVGAYQESRGLAKNFKVDKETFNSLTADARRMTDSSAVLDRNFTLSGFDLEAAENYAGTYYKKYNTGAYKSYKSDDANFVAQILIAAGVPENGYFHASLSRGEPTLSVINISSLIQYFRSVYGIKYYNKVKNVGPGTVSMDTYLSRSGAYSYDGVLTDGCDEKSFTIDDIEPGDCVTLNGTNGKKHIAYVLSVDYSKKKIKYAAHTSNAYGKNYSFSNIKGVLKTSNLSDSVLNANDISASDDLIVELAFSLSPNIISTSGYYTDRFDLEKAQSYAKEWYNSFNTAKYVKQPRDCANFVSQILIEAGIPETKYFHASRNYASWQTASTSNVPSLIQYFRSMYNVNYYNNTGKLGIGSVSPNAYMSGSNSYDDVRENACDGHSFSINDIQTGDCVTYNLDLGRGHIVYVLWVDYNSQIIHYTAHNNPAYDNDNGTISFSEIRGVLKTSEIAAGNSPTPAPAPSPSPSNYTLDDAKADFNTVNGYSSYIYTGTKNTGVVAALQRLLNYFCGSGLDVDGQCGPKTTAAIKAFQSANGLTVDGQFGTNSKNAMYKLLYPDPVPAPVPEQPVQTSGRKVLVFTTFHNVTRLVFDVYGGGTSNETLITIYPYHGAANQVFEMIPYDNTYYYLKCTYCDQYWNINRGSDANMNGKLQISHYENGSANVLFKLEDSGYREDSIGGKFYYIKDKEGYYLTIDESNGYIYTTPNKLDKYYLQIFLIADPNDSRTISFMNKGNNDSSSSSSSSSSSAAAAMLGDVNGDGKITITDQAMVSRYLGGESVSNFNAAAADVNRDGRINDRDVKLISQYLVNLISQFPDESSSSAPNNSSSVPDSIRADMNTVNNHPAYIAEGIRDNTTAVVSALQRLLNYFCGSGLDVDGICGPKTTAAIKAFQRANGLTVDGQFGVKSKQCMTNLVNNSNGGNAGISYSRGTNEQIIYDFLRNNLGVNKATACGILANIECESSFNPNASSAEYDGRESYGICQWNLGRLSSLKTYCSNNGYNYTSLEGQLYFLKYELNSSEKAAWRKMQGISDTRDGAGEAAYLWASCFERCHSSYYEKRREKGKAYWDKY